MRKLLLTTWLVLFFTSPAFSELKITGSLDVNQNQMVRLTVSGAADGSALIWDVDKEDIADVEELPGRLLFTGPVGKYKVKVRAISLKDGRTTIETARCIVTIGKAPPDPPGPGPDPVDPLYKKLQDAFNSETDLDKITKAKKLAALYRQAAIMDLSVIKTAGDLASALKKAANSLLDAKDLPFTRKAIQSELVAFLPSSPSSEMTTALKAKAVDIFDKLSKALDSLIIVRRK